MTIFPFHGGKDLIWDVTCCDTFFGGIPPFAAYENEKSETSKHKPLSGIFEVEPVIVETANVPSPQITLLTTVCADLTIFR